MNNELIDKIKSIIAKSDESAIATVRDIEKAIVEAENPNFKGKKPGDHFMYRGIEWVILGWEQGGVLCVTAEPIGKMPFDKNGNNNWRESSLREYLNTVFLAKLGEDDALLTIQSDLVADNGDGAYGTAVDYVGLLSCDLYREYRDVIPRYENWIWTCTPWACDPTYAGNVRPVDSSGVLCDYGAHGAGGVVPACVFIDNQ